MENTNQDQVPQILLTSVSMTTSSAEKIAANEDLLSEILLRLPVRSLLRFKCVSKPWLVLISSSDFSRTHTTRNFRSLSVSGFFFPTLTGGYLVGLDGARPKFPHSLAFMKVPHVRVVQSCNGLMLCSTNNPILADYYVCNPTTKKFSSIPPLPVVGHDSLYEFGINLVFDPLRSPHFNLVCIFGVMVPEPHNDGCYILTYRAHLYSSLSESWSSLEGPQGVAFASDEGVFCNDSLYWLCSDHLNLVCFEAEKQLFTTIAMSTDYDLISGRRDIKTNLWTCNGKLQLVLEFHSAKNLLVYEMVNDCSKWLVKYMIDLPTLFMATEFYKTYSYTILGVGGGQGDDDLQLLMKLENNEVILYDFKEKTKTMMPSWESFGMVAPFIESLSPLM